MAHEQSVQLLLSVGDESVQDPERVDAEARRLRNELAELDVESAVLPAAGTVPAGAKSGEAVALGTVLVTLLPAVVPKLVEFLQAWTLRGAGRTIKIRATAGDRTFDVEYSPHAGSERDLKELLSVISGALKPASGGGSA